MIQNSASTRATNDTTNNKTEKFVHNQINNASTGGLTTLFHAPQAANSTQQKQSLNSCVVGGEKQHWPLPDVERLLSVVKTYQSKHPKITKSLWKHIAREIDTDIHYTWNECHTQHLKTTKEKQRKRKLLKAESIQQQTDQLLAEKLQENLNKTKEDWNARSEQRQQEFRNLDNKVFDRFGSRTPQQVLLELEKRPRGSKLGLRSFVHQTWKSDVWQKDVLKQFGKTWLYGYKTTPGIHVEFHYNGGNKFDALSVKICKALDKWELCTKITGPNVNGKEGLSLKKLARECLSLDYAYDGGNAGKDPGAKQDTAASTPSTNNGWFKKAEIELGENHICLVQLLVLSVSLRLKILDRETELSSLRSNGVVLEHQTKREYNSFSSKDLEKAELQKKEMKSTSVDVVKYSPSVRRERVIKSLVQDIDRAVNMCEQMYAQSSKPSKPSKSCKNNRDDAAAPRLDVDTLHVLAHAKSVRALTLAVGGSHWIVSKWVRGYSTVSSVASAIVVSSTQFALKAATVRVAARYQRLHVRHLWVQENNRLKTLDETLLRRKRAELRQEYRKHKKRGRPGRIEMKNAKHQLDLIKMDIDHCLQKEWHPKHDMLRPSLDTPREWKRLGLPKPVKEKMPTNWIKCVPYYNKTETPYYVHEHTGLSSLINPLSSPLAKSTKHDIPTLPIIPTLPNKIITFPQLGPPKEAVSIVQIDPNDVAEQHRMYFCDAMASAQQSCDLLTSLGSPLLFEATAAMSRIYALASKVAESEGNQATGLDIGSSELSNMACDCIMLAMEQANEAGLRYTLEYASLCRRAARFSQSRRHDGDMSDAAERLKDALDIYKCLGLCKRGVKWHANQASLELAALGEFSGYGILHTDEASRVSN